MITLRYLINGKEGIFTRLGIFLPTCLLVENLRVWRIFFSFKQYTGIPVYWRPKSYYIDERASSTIVFGGGLTFGVSFGVKLEVEGGETLFGADSSLTSTSLRYSAA